MSKKNENPFANVDLHDYKPTREIAHTSSSYVFLAQSPSKQYVCLKLIKRPNDSTTEAQFFSSEANALSILNHKVISPVRDYFVNEQYYALVSDIKKGGSLQYLLEKRHFISNDESQSILYSLTTGLQYCHVRNVAHRNIKPTNILLDADKVFLVDFGIKQIDNINHTYNTSIPYKAPELLETVEEKIDERPGDIWSLGVILYEMITGKLPWSANQPVDFITQIKRGVFTFPPQVPSLARDLIQKMVDINPMHRISSHEILAHPWLSKIRKTNLRVATGKSVILRSNEHSPTKTNSKRAFSNPIKNVSRF